MLGVEYKKAKFDCYSYVTLTHSFLTDLLYAIILNKRIENRYSPLNMQRVQTFLIASVGKVCERKVILACTHNS